MVKYTVAACRDHSRWKRTKRGGTIVQFNDNDGKWVDVLRVGQSKHGRGLFAMQSYPAGAAVCAYFGQLVPTLTHPETESDMVMQSGVKMYVIKGAPSSAISGAVFVNDPRGSKKKPNVKIIVGSYNLKKHTLQMNEFKWQQKAQGKLHPDVMAVGTVIPYFKSVKAIKPGDEILMSYNWSASDWDACKKQKTTA